MVATILHVIFHAIGGITYNLFGPVKPWSYSFTWITGGLLVAVFAVMFITALPWFRKKKSQWRNFYMIHLGGAALFFVLLVVHGLKDGKLDSYKYVVPALIVYGIDRMVRHFNVSGATVFLGNEDSSLKPGRILCLRVKKVFDYRAGQYAEISVPGLNTREWHPFTIASAPHEEDMTFFIKCDGDWCTTLYDAFKSRKGDPHSQPLFVRVRGPFGAPAQHTGAYKNVVLISGGIGATPFASIAKDLQYRSKTHTPHHVMEKKKEHCSAAQFEDEKLPCKLNKSVEEIYGYHTDDDSNVVEVAEVQLEDALFRNDSLKFGSFITSQTDEALDLEQNSLIPEKISALIKGWQPRIRMLHFLHSSRVSLALLMMMVARLAIVCVAAIWGQANFGWDHTRVLPTGQWALLTDSVLALIVTFVMGITIALEISFMKGRFFTRSNRLLDFCAFVPWALVSIGTSLRSYGKSISTGALTIEHIVILLILQFILLANRMYRSLGSRSLLSPEHASCKCRCGGQVPTTDFVWTVKTTQEDEWLRDELSPLADGTSLKLHRFITRQKEEDIENEENMEHFSTQFGRPNWEKLLHEIVNRTTSSTEVGVFFCGPKPMGAAIKKAVKIVEVKSSLRGNYLAQMSDAEIRREYSVKSDDDIRRLRHFWV